MADVGKMIVKGPSEPVAKGAIAKVSCLIFHPMETGFRKDDNGAAIPAHFITEVTAEYMGKQVMKMEWTAAVSKNPKFSFDVKAGSGPVKVIAKDNKGGTFETSAEIQVK